MAPPEQIAVTVAYALPERQTVVALELPSGTSAGDAVGQSGLIDLYPELRAQPLQLAVFGRVVAATVRLQAGDRVEILRPLKHEPMAKRRQLAARGKTMGRGGELD